MNPKSAKMFTIPPTPQTLKSRYKTTPTHLSHCPKHSWLLTLSEQHMAHGGVHIVVNRVPTVDHEAIHKLHGFSPLSSESSQTRRACSLRPRSPGDPQHSKAFQEGTQTLRLGAQTPFGLLLGTAFCTALGEARSLRNHAHGSQPQAPTGPSHREHPVSSRPGG